MIRDLTYAVILTSIVLTSILIPVLGKVPSVSAFYGAIIRKGRKVYRAAPPVIADAQENLPAEVEQNTEEKLEE